MIRCFDNRTFTVDNETALLLVDMQRDFLSPCCNKGVSVEPLLQIVPALQRLLAAFRSAGLLVVHTRYGFKPDLSDLPESIRLHSQAYGEYGTMGQWGRILVRGEKGFGFVDELEPKNELIITKTTYGAFAKSNLDDELRNRNITKLIIGGVTTHCCVESTVREAVDRNYACLTLYDGTATLDPTLHTATFNAIQSDGHLFGEVATVDDVLAALS